MKYSVFVYIQGVPDEEHMFQTREEAQAFRDSVKKQYPTSSTTVLVENF